MMTTPHVAVLFGFGINCDHETAAVFDLVGGKAERVHVNHFISGKRSLDEFVIDGLPTTIPLHQRLMQEQAFIDGDYSIRWLEQDFLGS